MGASAAVLPGRCLGTCMDNLRRLRLIEAGPRSRRERAAIPRHLSRHATALRRELRSSGPVRGLGLLPGKVVRFAPDPTASARCRRLDWGTRSRIQEAGAASGAVSRRRPGLLSCHSIIPGAAIPGRSVARLRTTAGSSPRSVWQDNVFACSSPREEPGHRLPDPRHSQGLAGATDATAAGSR